MIAAHIDFEAYSSQKMGKHKDAVSTWRWAEDRTTGIICMSYRIGDAPIKTWVPDGSPFPQDLLDHIESGGPVYAHNAQMEKAMWRYCLPKYVDVPAWDNIEWRCTQAIANYKSLPGSLGGVADILNLEVRKGDPTLMRKWAEQARCLSDIPKADLDAICRYCEDDVMVEYLIHRRLGDLPPEELRVWKLDQKMNALGIRCDKDLAKAVIQLLENAKGPELERFEELVEGWESKQVRELSEDAKLQLYFTNKGKPRKNPKVSRLKKPTQNEKFREWLADEGVYLDDLAKDTVEKALEGELSEAAREALLIRQRTSKASVAKFHKMFINACEDGRLRGGLRYHGGSTGRWAGSGYQPQNLPSRGCYDDVEKLVDWFMAKDVETIEGELGNVFDAAKSVCRPTLTADKGSVLLVADYSAIEARVLPWIAGEEWKLDAFRSFDAGVGPGIYKLSYSKSFGTPIEDVKKPQRQIGKVQELALGYQGGVGAFHNMAIGYGVQIGSYLGELSVLNPELAEKAEEAWEYRGRKTDFDHDTFVAAEIVKIGWREQHPKTCQLWNDLEDDAIEAVRTGHCGNFTCDDRELHYVLPSGRALTYWDPKVVRGKYGPTIRYVRPLGPKMVSAGIYGGKWAENITQAVARDIMAVAMVRADEAGLQLLLTVHDEIVGQSKIEVAQRDLEKLQTIMEQRVNWAPTLPTAVEAFTSFRYRK